MAARAMPSIGDIAKHSTAYDEMAKLAEQTSVFDQVARQSAATQSESFKRLAAQVRLMEPGLATLRSQLAAEAEVAAESAVEASQRMTPEGIGSWIIAA